MLQVLLDALVDTAKVFPFLLLIYILIELLEHKAGLTGNRKILRGPLAPLIGSATGLVPQCGFSVMAAKLYDNGFIRTGTLLAVFLATSDEAFIIMLSSGAAAASIMPLALIKLVLAVGVGYLVNFLLSGEKLSEISPATVLSSPHEDESEVQIYLLSPLLHSLKVALYLLLVNIIFGCIIEEVGAESITAALIGGPYWQPLITAAIGLIPNCASSVIITGAYINGGIIFGSCVAGLCSNAGLGLVVLLKNTKKIKRNVLIITALYLISAAAGVVTNSIMVLAGLI